MPPSCCVIGNYWDCPDCKDSERTPLTWLDIEACETARESAAAKLLEFMNKQAYSSFGIPAKYFIPHEIFKDNIGKID